MSKNKLPEDKDNLQRKKEKPLSLYPLTMDEALAEVLKAKPPVKEPKPKKSKKDTPK